MMFERFTRDARSVVHLAVTGAPAGGTVDGVDLLLALSWLDAGDDGGSAARVLHAAGLDRARLEAAAATVDRPDRPARDAGASAQDAPARPDPDLDPEALAALGIDLDAVRARADEVFGPGALDVPVAAEDYRRSRSRRARFTPDAKKTLELALREAVRLHDRQITSAHLLLGVLRDAGSPAARTLEAAGADLPTLRASAEHTRAAEAA